MLKLKRLLTFLIFWIYFEYPEFRGYFMQTTIVKWGNSHGIRLPKAFLQSIKITENDPVDVILENEKIVIKKITQKEHKTTKQRLIDFYGENFSQHATQQKEMDWGKPVGNEIW